MKPNVKHHCNFIFTFFLAGIFILHSAVSYGQGTQVEFGQNRVQYKKFTWSFFETDKFVTYFYLGGQDIGKYVIQFAEKELEKVEEILEYKQSKRIQIMVYNDLSDLNQTNIGQGLELYNTGGVTKIIENKMFVYFDGNHQNLERQIREGLAQIVINHMMFGGNFQEILQNAVLLNLPKWFTEGLASYIGESWNVEMENRLRNGILSGKYTNFNKLSGEDAKFAGHALWHYVEEKYGPSAVPNLLYLTRINRSLESGFLFVLGGSVKSILSEMNDYYYDRFTQETNNQNEPVDSARVIKKPRKKRTHYQAKLSADEEHIAFVTNNLGKYRVHLYNKATGKSSVLLRGGIKTITLVRDYGYPLLSWSPDGKTLAVIYEKRDKLYMMIYNIETKDKIVSPITKFQQINDFRFTNDPRLLVMSAVNKGQSDIYTYYIPTTLTEQITNDYYDDLHASYVDMEGKKGIMFISNRPNETLPWDKRLDTVLLRENFDVYFYDLNKSTNKLVRITNTPYFQEYMPMQYDEKHFAYLGNNNGIKNRYVGYIERNLVSHDTVVYFPDSVVTNPKWDLDSLIFSNADAVDTVEINPVYKDVAYTFPYSDYTSNIIEQDISPKTGKSLDMFRENFRYEFYIHQLDTPLAAKAPKLENTLYRQHYLNQIREEQKFELDKKSLLEGLGEYEKIDTVFEKQPERFFQSDFNTAPHIDVTEYYGDEGETEEIAAEPIFQFTKVAPYRVKFSTDYVMTQVDNGLIITQYERFNPGVPVYNTPPISGLITLGISDLFEDYRITGGFRFPFDFSGSEFFIAYESLRKRLDKRIMYYREVDKRSFPLANGNYEAKYKTNYFELRLNHPFDVVNAFRYYIAYRHENVVVLSVDSASLFDNPLPGERKRAEHWLFGKVEFVHDNTIHLDLNIRSGLRFKIYAEIHKEIEYRIRDLGRLRVNLPSMNNAYFAVVGADFRHYQKIYKTIIWANRFAWASSFGTNKLIYYLGGVDGWIAAKFDQTTPISEDNDYAFQALATNMRGFDQNVRNGNSYVLFNSELRIPIFSVLINSTIKSDFIRNFQIVGFTDIGTAWSGINPYDNPVFTETVPPPPYQDDVEPPVVVRVDYFKNPIVLGYGFGLRTSLFGYFIRFDVAWGNDSGDQSKSPKLYFSLSLDF